MTIDKMLLVDLPLFLCCATEENRKQNEPPGDQVSLQSL